jgi:HEAT repeat protein
MGRLHALWALDALDDDGARQAIRDALRDRSPRVRLQAARSCGLRGDREAIGGLAALLADSDPAVRREAAIALGSTGGPQALPPLVAALGDPDRFAAWSIRTAIRRIGYPTRDAMGEALLDPRRAESALILADESWCVPVIEALTLSLKATKEPSVRARMVAALAGQYRKFPDWNGEWWGPDPLASAFPRKTENWDRSGMDAVLQGLRQGLLDGTASVRFPAIIALGEVGRPAAAILREGFSAESNPSNQEALVEAMGAATDGESVRLLTNLVADPGRSEPLRAAALDALARFRGPDVLRARLSLLYDSRAPEALVARALPPLARDGILPPNDLAGFLESPSALVRASALMSLNVKKALPVELKALILARLDDPSADVRQAAVIAAGTLQLREAIPRLIQAASQADAELRTGAISALCRMPDPRAAPIYREAANDTDPSLRRAGAQALKAIGGGVDPSVDRTGSSHPAIKDTAAFSRFASTHQGDPRSGEALFFENKSLACGRCHVVNGRGTAHQGPDLSGLGARYDEARIIRALLEPSQPVAAAHHPVTDGIRSLTPLQFTDLISFLRRSKQ